jgi:endoglucanase
MRWFFTPILLSLLLRVKGAIRGISVYGFETEHASLQCDFVSSYDQILANVQALGFNTVRLPFCHDYLHNTNMSAMDNFFEAVRQTQLDVVLDFHRIVNYKQSPKPYDNEHPFQMFLDDWLFILDRYQHNNHLVGVDLFNEPQSNEWEEWNALATKAVKAIEDKFPYRFFYMVGCVSWGSDCSKLKIDVPYDNRVFHTVHRYSWHTGDWDISFGNIGDGQKMIVGEYGAKSDLPNQMDWFKDFLKYLKRRNIMNSFFWTYAVSSDTGGIFQDDCRTLELDKMRLLWDYWGYTPPDFQQYSKQYLRTTSITFP